MVTIGDFMTRDVITIDADQSTKFAADLMTYHKISCLVVVKDSLPVGILTERDLIKKVVAKDRDSKLTSVREVMSSPVHTIAPDQHLGQVSQFLKNHGIRRAPVVDPHGRLLGLVTQTDIVKETEKLHHEHQRLMWYQNFQFWIIVVCVLFVLFLIYKMFFSSVFPLP
ncbi:CBS domain-containing protein [Candidatus Woesearchaeota archaeon]|nr:CBS domain-containing protein [Candidatus Woesearchaeota archaeon]